MATAIRSMAAIRKIVVNFKPEDSSSVRGSSWRSASVSSEEGSCAGVLPAELSEGMMLVLVITVSLIMIT